MRRICKHNGTILITVLMCSVAALVSALLVLASANRCFSVLNWEYQLLKRENVAVQAEAITKTWFKSSVEEGILDPDEFVPGAQPKDDPYLKLPDGLLAELKIKNEGIIIDAKIIDQNYSDSFTPEAERLDVPRGMPSMLSLLNEDESTDICYVKRYYIRTTAALSAEDVAPYVLAENVIVIKDPSGALRTIYLYTKKH